jgi:hypothetical protein
MTFRFQVLRSWRFDFVFLACLISSLAGFNLRSRQTAPKYLNDPNRSNSQESEQYEYRKYRNERFNFTFEYPRQWEIIKALNGGGARIAPKEGPHPSRIDAAGSVVQADQHGTPRTLEEDFEFSLESLKKYRPHAAHKITNVTLVKKELTTFQGLPAIFSKIAFDIDGQTWMEEGLTFHDRDDRYRYDVGITCR